MMMILNHINSSSGTEQFNLVFLFVLSANLLSRLSIYHYISCQHSLACSRFTYTPYTAISLGLTQPSVQQVHLNSL